MELTFSLSIIALVPLFLAKVLLFPTLILFQFTILWFGLTVLLFFRQKRFWRFRQLLTLWCWSHPFTFDRSNVFKFLLKSRPFSKLSSGLGSKYKSASFPHFFSRTLALSLLPFPLLDLSSYLILTHLAEIFNLSLCFPRWLQLVPVHSESTFWVCECRRHDYLRGPGWCSPKNFEKSRSNIHNFSGLCNHFEGIFCLKFVILCHCYQWRTERAYHSFLFLKLQKC